MGLTFKTLDTQIMPAPESRRMTFTISTGSVDRDNDTLDPKGWQLDNYKSNPVVLFAHDYKSLPVAKCIDIKSTDTALIATAEFLPEGKHPFADTVYDMLKAGFLNATSVGFRAIEHQPNNERKGYDYKRQELMEFSIVPIPSNQDALAQRGIDSAKKKEWVKAITEWASKQDDPAKVAIIGYQERSGRLMVQTDEQFIAFEKDYLVESEDGSKTLPDARIGKLCALHGIKEPESTDHTQREALRKVHRSAMDAYANAHHADTVMTSIATMEANIPTAAASAVEWKDWGETFIKSKKATMKQAHGAIQRAKDHAQMAADQCAQMGGKALADLAIEHKEAAEAQLLIDQKAAEQKALEQESKELWLELDEDEGFDIDPKELATVLSQIIAEEAGAQVRAALNTALGRLD